MFPTRPRSAWLALAWQTSLLFAGAVTSHAQVIRDGSIGSAGSISGPDYDIPASLGAKSLNGTNVFHSFRQFDLQSGESANFQGDGARNILARVTGGTASSINGRINADANLFLMNPSGIVFHENASISVNGSFFATTADYIRLGNDGRFGSTLADSDKVLSSADPSAFGFLTPNPRAIRVLSSNFVDSNVKTVGLVGGDVLVENGTNILGDDIQIHSVRAAGEATISLPTVSNGLRYAHINSENFSKHGAVTVGKAAPAGGSSTGPFVNANRVVIRGGTLVMTGAQVYANPAAPGDGVQARVTDSLVLENQTIVGIIPTGDLTGTAVADLTAGEATIKDSAILSFSGLPGSGGNIRLTISGALRLDNGSVSTSVANGDARGGDVSISAGRLEMTRGGSISTQGDSNTTGRVGDLVLNVDGAISLTEGSAVFLSPQGDRSEKALGEQLVVTAGDVFISGRASGLFHRDFTLGGTGGSLTLNVRNKLTILDEGQIAAETTGRAGAAISVKAGSVLISGAGVTDNLRDTGILSTSFDASLGRSGDSVTLRIDGNLEVLDGGVIASNTLGAGAGGLVDISAQNVTVTGRGGSLPGPGDNPRGISAQNRGSDSREVNGPSGGVRILARGTLTVRNAGEIIADTIGSGKGGNIDIKATDLNVSTHGTIAARTRADVNAGAGGNVRIDVGDELNVQNGGLITASTLGAGAGGTVDIRGLRVSITGTDAMISAVSGGMTDAATGRGGDVFVRANDLRIANDGQITASTYGTGDGGSVRITADALEVTDGDSVRTAGISAQTLSLGNGGAGGQIRIEAGDFSMRGAGAAISTQSFGPGNSGQIQISADTVTMRDRSTIQSASTGTGSAGSISLMAADRITLLGGSSLSVAAAQSNAGNIRVRAGSNITLTGSRITAQAGLNGGNIDIRVRDLLFLTNSEITAAAGLNGGNIFIDPIFVFLNRSVISADAILGRGGNIRIISDFFFAPRSTITATSELGIDGSVRIDAFNNDLNDNLVELPSTLLNAESLLQELCSMKVDKFSSFISEGRGGLPPLPGEALPSLMIVR